ncbi:MAG: hypothetical protein M1821_002547 [Bathelium mastoideum]|nr:MAG: hypothetical protein M1821_002547 [Bathelium mastoideum]
MGVYRLVEIEIDLPSGSKVTHPYSSTNSINKVISGRDYTATVQALKLNSKLLHVNSESRKAALSFYRVHIPCHLKASTGKTSLPQVETGRSTEAIFYFNPEYDFLHLSTRRPAEHTFVDFLHDLKAHDPRGVGLLNLALGVQGMSAGLKSLKSLVEIHEAPAKASLVASLSQLQEIFWVAQSCAGRGILEPSDYNNFPGVGIRFNHPMPVKAIIPSFDLLQNDPRPMGPELKYVLTATADPREIRKPWQELLRKWDIRQPQPTRERVLFACVPLPYKQQIYDINTADKFLIEEQENWLETQRQWREDIIRHTGKFPVEGPKELARAVGPAVGFRLFPADALGPLEGDISRMKKVFDMTGWQPELALSNIS